MATLLELTGPGKVLEKLTVLRPREQEVRCLYVGPTFRNWVRTKLPTLASERGVGEAPTEQLIGLARVFCSGLVLAYGRQFNPLDRVGRDMWKLKTYDLRIFGWFPLKDHFVAVAIEAKSWVVRHKLNHGFAGEVERFRDSLDLDPPKSISGTDPNDVVSNFHSPR
jgi:hypothetical protein